MKLAFYSPTFRNVLLRKVNIEKSAGGIILAKATEYVTEDNTDLYEVVKTGKDCTEVKVGDYVKIMKAIFPEKFELDCSDSLLVSETDREMRGFYTLYQIPEMQIIGFFRIEKPVKPVKPSKNVSVRAPHSSKPKTTRGRKL